jgi:hypothetical protein
MKKSYEEIKTTYLHKIEVTKSEFINDLGKYGFKYIDKYIDNNKGPEWLTVNK